VSRIFMMSASCVFLIVPATAMCQVPMVDFVAPGPGLDAPFDNNAEVNTYGKKELVAGWAFDTFSGSPVKLNPIARYSTSLENDNSTVTPMSPLEDWVLSFTYGVVDASGIADGIVLFTRAKENTAEERNIFGLRRQDNTVKLLMGDLNQGNDSWLDIPGVGTIDMTPPLEGEKFRDFTVHYKSHSSTLDAYVDGVKVASDFTLAHGDYAIEFIQLDPSLKGTITGLEKDKFRMLKIGQLANPSVENADFDEDEDVDGADFLSWQRGFGALGIANITDGDANGDMNVDDLDLEIWQNQFGITSSAASAVPEPTSLAMITFVSLSLFLLRP